MTQEEWQRAKHVVALAIESPVDERPDILLRHCGSDLELRRYVQELLDAYDGSAVDQFLETQKEKLAASLAATLDLKPPSKSPKRTTGTVATEGQPVAWGDFLLLEQLGRGGFGVVYRAWERSLKRELALKIIDSRKWKRGGDDTILREGQMLARVSHPNVVRLHGVHRYKGELALAMECIRGRTLANLITTHGPMSAKEVAEIGATLCSALAAVHACGLVHRDVKASNVMRANDGRLVLMDFGAGRELLREPHTHTQMIGTPVYMSPEVRQGAHATPASDIYSLGVLLHYLLSARYPEVGARDTDTVSSESLAHHPQTLVQLVRAMLAEDPAERPVNDPRLKRRFIQAVPRPTRPRPSAPSTAPAVPTALPVPVPAPHAQGGVPAIFSGLTPRMLWPVACVPLAFLLMGMLTTWEYNQVLGREGAFRVERVHHYLLYGAMTCTAPAVNVVLLAIAAVGATFAWRLTCGVLPAATSRVRDVLTRIRQRLEDREILTREFVEQAACVVAAVGLLATFYAYQDILSALTTSANTGPREVFGVFRKDARSVTSSFRAALLLILVGLASVPLITAHLRLGASSRGTQFARVGLMVLVALVLCGCWRVMFGQAHPEAMFGSANCFVIGEHGSEWLLHCPGHPTPRSRVVSKDDSRVRLTGHSMVAFDGYPVVPGYASEANSE